MKNYLEIKLYTIKRLYILGQKQLCRFIHFYKTDNVFKFHANRAKMDQILYFFYILKIQL